jgi:hypothetical protein
MENEISINQLRLLDISNIKKLEKQVVGIQDVIENMRERNKFMENIEQTKTGNFAEDIVNEI